MSASINILSRRPTLIKHSTTGQIIITKMARRKKKSAKPVKSIYSTEKYKRWRKKVFRRDHFTCQLCGIDGTTLNAHHIQRKADHPNLTFILSNGITLCEKCHHVVTGKEKVFAPLLQKIVNKTLTFEFVVEFFQKLSKYYRSLVRQFKRSGKWLLMPEVLILHIKKFQSIRLKKSRSKTGKK